MFPQTEASASSLNTNDVFVLKSPNALFVWRGVGASDEEMEAAKHVVGFLGGSASQVSEGKEPGGCPLRTNILYVIQQEEGQIISVARLLLDTYSPWKETLYMYIYMYLYIPLFICQVSHTLSKSLVLFWHNSEE